MNENYLNQLLSAGAPGANSAVGNYFASSGMTMNYPIWTSTDGDPVSAFDGILIANRKEIFFIKKEIPKFKFPKEPMTISFDNVSDEDMDWYFSQKNILNGTTYSKLKSFITKNP